MNNNDLNALISEYKNDNSIDSMPIKARLNTIEFLCQSCDSNQFTIANEITSEFCKVVQILKKQHKEELSAASSEQDDISYSQQNDLMRFREYTRDKTCFHNGYELLDAFYNHFIETESNLTMNDYKARINTFANKYLDDMLIENLEYRDPVLFIYDNIEYILAIFKTTDENGKSVKQKVNIRSALRKLNDFKHNEDIK